MDYEVCRKIWDSQIAAQFTVQNRDDILPFYTMLPRFSYFSVVLKEIMQFFHSRDDGINLEIDNIWLESKGIPLKMYIPIGVIFDLNEFNSNSTSTWNIVIKTSLSPEGYRPIDREAMEQIYLQNLKEADFLKRKAEAIQNMQKDEHRLLWASICNNHFDDFWGINKKLMDTSDKMFDSIPLRVYEKNRPAFRQTLLNPRNENGDLVTMGQAVSNLLTSPPADMSQLTLISHGIQIPAETPLIYAAKNLTYPDNFVHVCCVLAEPK